MKKRAKLAFYHSVYVGGLTFFSTLGTKFFDESLTYQEVQFCLISTFIAMGLAFFSSISLQRMNGCYQESPNQYRYHPEQKRIKEASIYKGIMRVEVMSKKIENSTKKHARLLNNLLVVTHSHTNLHDNGCIA